MGKIIFASGLISDAGSIEAFAATAAGYPVTNLLTMQPGERARFTDPGAAYVEIDLGTARPITFAGILAHNISATGQVRWRAADTQGDLTADPDLDTMLGSAWPASGKPDADVFYSFRLFDEAVNRRWWRLDVSDGDNTDGYLDIGRLMVADAWRPARNVKFGWGPGWLDPSAAQRSVAGHTYPTPRPKHRVFGVPLGFQSEDDMLEGLYELQRKCGAERDIFVAVDPDADKHLHRKSVHGTMLGTSQPLINTHFALWETSVRVEELLP